MCVNVYVRTYVNLCACMSVRVHGMYVGVLVRAHE